MSDAPEVIEKYPADVRQFSFDWSALQELTNETITSVAVTSSPNDLTIGLTGIADKVTTVVLSGGTAGTLYRIIWTINTSGSHVIQREGGLQVIIP